MIYQTGLSGMIYQTGLSGMIYQTGLSLREVAEVQDETKYFSGIPLDEAGVVKPLKKPYSPYSPKMRSNKISVLAGIQRLIRFRPKDKVLLLNTIF